MEAVFFQSQQRSAETGMVGNDLTRDPVSVFGLTSHATETLLRVLQLRHYLPVTGRYHGVLHAATI
jgi:hypothetical protein